MASASSSNNSGALGIEVLDMGDVLNEGRKVSKGL
jgi:hypothetical protein